MRNIRKSVGSLSLVAILSTLMVSATAFAASFTDVSTSAYYYNAAEELVSEGVITAGGNFNPGTPAT